MKTQIHYLEELPEEMQFFELFETTGWNEKYRLSSKDLMEALKRSWYILSAYHQDKLVGFGRIICDGKVHALILDLIVIPEYQNQGIGGKLLDSLVDKCKAHNIRDIQLFSAKDKAAFYEKHGFRKRQDNAPGMEVKQELES